MLARKPNWIAGTLELTSKVRYGLSTRGVPQFRFIPYDSSFPPMAVGCSVRNLFYNIHAIVEPSSELCKAKVNGNELAKATLVQNLGTPSESSETTLLLTTYAFDSQKELRKEFPLNPSHLNTKFEPFREEVKEGITFHIDPKGCRDVDDSFTFTKLSDSLWRVWIHIADVDAWILPGSALDQDAYKRATTFYTSNGYSISPMLPKVLSEELASLKGDKPKPTLSLCFLWEEGNAPTNFQWKLTYSKVDHSFTYEDAHSGSLDEFGALQRLAFQLGGDPGDSHSWVEEMMILYNTKAGELLKQNNTGILRRHSGENLEKVEALEEIVRNFPNLKFLTYEAAEFCLPTDENTFHKGLERSAYAYASSPLRRYADLLNQRIIKQILSKIPLTLLTDVKEELIQHLNRRSKQAKAFSRDLFFNQVLSTAEANSCEEGIVLGPSSKGKGKGYKVYLEAWKTIITVRTLGETIPEKGSRVRLEWYEDRGQAGWKNRIVFKQI
jgi:exoribonuclease R